jgi:flagellar biosynthesis protein FliQ
MNEVEVIEIGREAIIVMLKISGPILIAALVMGVIISLIQAITQIQEMTVSFVPKVVVIFLLTLWLLPFMLATLNNFTQGLAQRIVDIGTS